MAFCCERHQRIVQPICLPVGLCLPPVSRVPGNAKDKFMVTPVLVRLICVAGSAAVRRWADTRRAQQRQSNGVVTCFVGTIFVVGENGGAEGSTLVSEVNPAVAGYFKL